MISPDTSAIRLRSVSAFFSGTLVIRQVTGNIAPRAVSDP